MTHDSTDADDSIDTGDRADVADGTDSVHAGFGGDTRAGPVDRRTVLEAAGAVGLGSLATGVAAGDPASSVHLVAVGVEYDLDRPGSGGAGADGGDSTSGAGSPSTDAPVLERAHVDALPQYVVEAGRVTATPFGSGDPAATLRDHDRVVAAAGLQPFPATVEPVESTVAVPTRLAADLRPVETVSVAGSVPVPTVDLRADGTDLAVAVDGADHAVAAGAVRALPAATGTVDAAVRAATGGTTESTTLAAEPRVRVRNYGLLDVVE